MTDPYDPCLEDTFRMMKSADRRRAAEIAYVLAVLSFREGDAQHAVQYGRESVALFEEMSIQTLEDAAARYSVLNGVALPDYVHEGVVRERLRSLGVRL